MRINKYLSECGVCSRREADRLLAAGHVSVNGRIAEQGMQIDETVDEVTVNGNPVVRNEEKIYLALNKPVGIVCTFETREKNNLGDFIHYPKRVTYAGRLDKNSEGLLILTDDGDLIQKMMAARNAHEKEYVVTVNKDIDASFAEKMQRGVYLKELDTTTRPCRVEILNQRTFRIILTQGLNRQIRRMCKAFGYGVTSLKRTRVVNVKLGSLKTGKMRELTREEVAELKKIVG